MASATSGYYGPSFPLIQIDPVTNYPNAANNIKKITVEEWQDILHHTHKLPEILDNDGNFLGQNASSDGSVSLEAFNELKNTVDSQKEIIQSQASIIADLQESIAELTQTVNSLKSSSGIMVADWDATKEGIQDENGNTIG